MPTKKKKHSKEIKFIAVSAIVAILISASSYYAGFQSGTLQPKNIIIKHVSNAENPDDVSADFSVFWEAWDKLKSEYINASEVSDQDLIYGAVEGLANAFGDPHTIFLSPSDSQTFYEDVRSNFSGIGAEIGIREDRLRVIAPLKDSPAEKAGLKPGDIILQVDGASTDGMTVEEAVKVIRGERGTNVVLTVFREGDEESHDIEITRDNIVVPTVEYEIIDDNIIHLNIFSFAPNTPTDFRSQMLQALLEGGDGMILDLRNNPGGFLDVSINLAGWFLDKGDIVVSEKFSSGDDRVFRAIGNEALKDFPIVILVNEGSASASEILAGALRVNRGTTIIGTTSFGKGTVQELKTLSDNSTLKVTIANWLLPDGSIIEGNGLIPDIEVKFTDEDIEAQRDVQLDRAVEELKKIMAQP